MAVGVALSRRLFCGRLVRVGWGQIGGWLAPRRRREFLEA